MSKWRPTYAEKHAPDGQVFIYALVDIRDPWMVFYVGGTRLLPRVRTHDHTCRARRGNTEPVYEWIRKIMSEGSNIVAIDIQLVKESDRWDAERYWIQRLIQEGHPLQNRLGRKKEVKAAPASVSYMRAPSFLTGPDVFYGS